MTETSVAVQPFYPPPTLAMPRLVQTAVFLLDVPLPPHLLVGHD